MNSNNADAKPIAFVISPIGERDSPIRKRSDQILTHIIEPIVSEFGYEVVRADKISKPGIITTQIINHIINDQLMIADLTGHNPNVFYELAIRHVIKKPVIQLIRKGERIPFDVSVIRTIQIDHQDLDSVDEAKKEIRRQIESLKKDHTLVDSPISVAVDFQSLKRSDDPQQKAIVELRDMLSSMRFQLGTINNSIHRILRELEVPPEEFSSDERIKKIQKEIAMVLERLGDIKIQEDESVLANREAISKSLNEKKEET